MAYYGISYMLPEGKGKEGESHSCMVDWALGSWSLGSWLLADDLHFPFAFPVEGR